MATDFQVILRADSNLPEDHAVNTLYFESGGLQSDEGIADDIHAAYQSNLLGFLSESIGGMTIKGYDPGRNVEGPKFTKSYSFNPTGSAGPAEVALCLSYYSAPNLPRRRGRVYIGPLSNNQMSERPGGALVAGLLAWASAISGAGGVDALWQQVSKTTGQRNDVTNWWVDNAWDTQRRRGPRPTARSTGS